MPNGTVHSRCTNPTQATVRSVIVSVSTIQTTEIYQSYCVFSHDVMAAIFVSQNNETAAIFVSQNNETAATFVSQTSPVGVELFPYVNAFFCSNKFA